MTTKVCTAPIRGHRLGSQEQRDCPVHGTSMRLRQAPLGPLAAQWFTPGSGVPLPQDRVPDWEGEFSRTPLPVTPGTIIYVVDAEGRYGNYRLAKSEQGEPVWRNVNDTSLTIDPADVVEWMPSAFPGTIEGHLEHAFRNAMQYIDVREERLGDAAAQIMAGLGTQFVPRFSRTLEGFPVASIDGESADGTPFRVHVVAATSPTVAVDGPGDGTDEAATAAQRAHESRQAIAAWARGKAEVDKVRAQASALSQAYQERTGVVLETPN